MKIPRFCAVLLVLGLAGSRGSAQSTADAAVSAKVDSVVEAQQKAQKIPGVSLAVCRDGKIIKASGYGLANVELGVPVTPETIFQTGSVGETEQDGCSSSCAEHRTSPPRGGTVIPASRGK